MLQEPHYLIGSCYLRKRPKARRFRSRSTRVLCHLKGNESVKYLAGKGTNGETAIANLICREQSKCAKNKAAMLQPHFQCMPI